MNAQQAKAATYSVRPPVRPPQAIYDAIEASASKGLRRASVPERITEEMEWWLADEGYTFITVDDPTACDRAIAVALEW